MTVSFAPTRAALSRAAAVAAAALLVALAPEAQPFERVATDIGNAGLSVTNAGTLGRPGVRNDPSGIPSFEYPLDSGIEHLFEAGLWVGARRADGVISVRTGAVTSSGGYSPGAPGFEFAQQEIFQRRSSLSTSPFFSPLATSQQDLVTSYSDTLATLPGTSTPLPDVQNQLGLDVRQTAYAWSFPFTEYFVIVEYDITNVSDSPLTDVWVGIWDDLVVRNVVTTTEGGGAFFNKGARGILGYPVYEGGTGDLVNADPDSQYVNYAFNAGGLEESLNTYGALAFLGAEWDDPGGAGRPAARRFFHPNVAAEYEALGLPVPRFNPRYWLFGGNDPDPALARPADDLERYERMQRPYPDPTAFNDDVSYRNALEAFLGDGQGTGRIQTDGTIASGNWISLTSVGPFAELAPGQSVTVTFALVAALKPDEFQSVPVGREADTPEARALLRNNVFWAQETFAGEDADYDGTLDPGEDINGNGVLDRYLIPEPPSSPVLRVELEQGKAILYWNDFAEQSVDPVTGRTDFEGYRIYRSDPGDDQAGNILGEAGLIAQYDRPGNEVGFNNGLDPIRLDSPVTFPGDTETYTYRFEADGLLDGWQYAFAVTAFDEGDTASGLVPLESSKTTNAVRVFPGPEAGTSDAPGVFPNPYRVQSAWDGPLATQRKLYFYNLPARAQIRVYSLAGEIVAEMDHDAEAGASGDIRWFQDFSTDDRVVAGGVHAWDILSDNSLRISSGLYLFSVRDLDTGETETGKFVILR
ncbi:MAG: hypothetical protein AAFQ43_01890 [Bacteroidota bacterium]